MLQELISKLLLTDNQDSSSQTTHLCGTFKPSHESPGGLLVLGDIRWHHDGPGTAGGRTGMGAGAGKHQLKRRDVTLISQ